MSRIKTYTTYTEVTNGLFVDIPDEEFTFLPDDLVTQMRPILVGTAGDIPSDREIAIMTGRDGYIEFQRAMEREMWRNRRQEEIRRTSNEGVWHQLRNMSEREAIQYLDRISEENEQYNSTI